MRDCGPAGLLQGTGKFMWHVKLRPGVALDEPSLAALIAAAHREIIEALNVGMPDSRSC